MKHHRPFGGDVSVSGLIEKFMAEKRRSLGEMSAHKKEQIVFTTTTYMWDRAVVEAAAAFEAKHGAFDRRSKVNNSLLRASLQTFGLAEKEKGPPRTRRGTATARGRGR